jgi:polar amino acid transport system substrate-binding protein
MRKFTTTVAVFAVAALSLTACGSDDGGDNPLGLISAGTIKICSDLPYAPFELEDSSKPSGYGGFDIDLMQAIADNLELKISVQATGFDGIQSGTAMEADQCDLAASAMTITDDRKENITFSDGYYDSLQSLLVADDSGIASIDDVDGKKIAVQDSTTGQAYAQEHATGADLVAYPDDPTMWTAIQAGQVVGILQDLPVNLVHAEEGGYTIVQTFDTNEQYGFGFKKTGKEALVKAVNEQLQALRDSGKYDEIYNTYFSTEE